MILFVFLGAPVLVVFVVIVLLSINVITMAYVFVYSVVSAAFASSLQCALFFYASCLSLFGISVNVITL